MSNPPIHWSNKYSRALVSLPTVFLTFKKPSSLPTGVEITCWRYYGKNPRITNGGCHTHVRSFRINSLASAVCVRSLSVCLSFPSFYMSLYSISRKKSQSSFQYLIISHMVASYLFVCARRKFWLWCICYFSGFCLRLRF